MSVAKNSSIKNRKLIIFITIIVEILTLIARFANFGLLSVFLLILFVGRGCLFLFSGIYFAKSEYKTKMSYILFVFSCLTSLLYAFLWIDTGGHDYVYNMMIFEDMVPQIVLSCIFLGANLISILALYIYTKRQKILHEAPRRVHLQKYILVLALTFCSVIIIITANLLCITRIMSTWIGPFTILVHPVLFVTSGICFAKSQSENNKLSHVLFFLMCATGIAYVAFYPSISYVESGLTPSLAISGCLFMISTISAIALLFCTRSKLLTKSSSYK